MLTKYNCILGTVVSAFHNLLYKVLTRSLGGGMFSVFIIMELKERRARIGSSESVAHLLYHRVVFNSDQLSGGGESHVPF